MPKGHSELADAAWLTMRYVTEQRTLDEIAQEVGCTNSAVCMALRKHGIQARTAAQTRMLRGTTSRRRFALLGNGEWLRKRYTDDARSQSEIAEEVGCTIVAVLKAMRQHGITPRKPGAIRFGRHPRGTMLALHDVEWLRVQREQGRSREDIAAELGCTVETLAKALWRQGIRIRDPLPHGDELQTAPIRTRTTSGGYVHVWAPNHPAASSERGYVPRHRLVAEAALGRFLTKSEVVHHLNITPGDDRLENLMVFPSNAMHMSFHANPPTWVPRCECCGKPNPESLKGRPDGVPLLYKAS
jgi:hypothetical protein